MSEASSVPTSSPGGAPPGELTNSQLLVWTAQKLAADLPCYNMIFAFRIEGDLDPGRFEEAFRSLLAASDVLRTVVEEVDGAPRQRVEEAVPWSLELVDLRGEADVAAALSGWLDERGAVPLDLSRRLFDTALLRTGPRCFVWFVNVHHIAIDGWSYALLYRRLAERYRLAVEGRLGEAPALPSFADYARREREARASEANREAETWWRRRLAGQLDAVPFYGRTAFDRAFRERRRNHPLSATQTERLRRFVERESADAPHPDLALLGAGCALVFAYLHRLSGNRRLSLGLPFHNRREWRDGEILGLLQQTYPVQIEVEEGDSLAALARKSVVEAWAALRHARHGVSNTRAPGAYEVMFNLPRISFPPFAGLPTEATRLHSGYSQGEHALFFHLHDFNARGSLTLDVDFSEGVFPPRRQEEALGHVSQLLDELLARPDRPVAEAEMLAPAERRRIVAGFNRTVAPYPREATIADLFEAQARRTPERLAVVEGGSALSYAALEARADAWARLLREGGVGPGVRVAVCAGRSLETVTALLGIFKAGGAYVPLDPTHPAERLAFVLADAEAPVLLTEERLLGVLPRHDAATILLDGGPLAGPSHGGPPPRASTPEDLAYVIYTSGSTGKPKGAAVPQRALVNVIWWQMREATRLASPVTLQSTPLTFDVSLQELFATWCCGGKVVLPRGDVRRDPEALLRLLVEERIEQLFMIFTPLQQLAEAAERTGVVPAALREVYTAGEQVQITPSVERFFERIPDCRFHNQYGSAEDFIATAHTLEGPASTWERLPPIGRPIANTRIHIVDRGGRPVPVGVVGELLVGGVQVPLGYLNRPELTAERLVPDPFSEDPSSRLFRTGDLGCHRDDGAIEFVGRADHQVKLRGFRIELGEIEAVLGQHPAVRKAVVALREDAPGDRRLVAYVVADGAAGLAAGAASSPATRAAGGKLVPEWRRYLADRLPEPMVPAAFVVLDALPETPSGKVNRLALPPPADVRPDLDAPFVEPRSAVEREIAAIWRRILRLDRVGLRDDFFSLGGQSLMLVEVHTELRRRYARPFSVIDLFGLPTVSDQARFVTSGEGAQDRLAGAEERAERRRAAVGRRSPPVEPARDGR